MIEASQAGTTWLTAKQAAAYLQVDRRTLLAWARAGRVKGHILSGTQRHIWRFKIEDLDAPMIVTAPNEGAVLHSITPSVARPGGIQ